MSQASNLLLLHGEHNQYFSNQCLVPKSVDSERNELPRDSYYHVST